MVEHFKTRMKASEYFQLPETTQPMELIDGEVIMSPAPVPVHQRVKRRIVRLLEDLIPNGEVFDAPIDVHLDDGSVPQPDALWVAENSQCVVGDKRLEGPPDLIAEVFSPGTTRYDKITKFKLYERHGVREYWMADPHEQYIEVYRHENGRFVLQGIYEPGQSFESAVLGKMVDVNKIFGTEAA